MAYVTEIRLAGLVVLRDVIVGIATGNPGVFLGYPYPPQRYDGLMGNDVVN